MFHLQWSLRSLVFFSIKLLKLFVFSESVDVASTKATVCSNKTDHSKSRLYEMEPINDGIFVY